MICPKCGVDNKTKFKFCVKCGANLEDPTKVNIEQIDKGGYRSEDDYASADKNFTIGGGTFTINDRVPEHSSNMFTAEELNESIYDDPDEPYIPKLDPDMIAVPDRSATQNNPQMQQQTPSFAQPQYPNQQFMQGQPMMQSQMPQGQPMQQMPQGQPMMQPQMQQGQTIPQMPQGQPMQQMYGQQMYGQPMMQPQIIGYDFNGMPIYAPQPMMQPQIIGYDFNGMPIYAPQPMMGMYPHQGVEGGEMPQQPMNAQPMPGMGMPQGMPQPMQGMGMPQGMPQPMQGMGMPQGIPQPMQGMGMPQGIPQPMQGMGMPQGMPQPMQGMGMPQGIPQPMPQPMQGMGMPQGMPQPVQPAAAPEPVAPEQNEPAAESNSTEQPDDDSDFFSKPKARARDMNDVSASGLDISTLERQEKKRPNRYMTAAPEANADELSPNVINERNKRYMKATATVNADELQEHTTVKPKVSMNITGQVNADELQEYVKKAQKVVMTHTETANADELETYEPEHIEPIMGSADYAVEALPKKKEYVDEIDAIELPESMKAKKTVKPANLEIPALPEL